ncbi:hypothetical protein HN385_03950 [archaeon]|nr:hypothetical protein [archaeon]
MELVVSIMGEEDINKANEEGSKLSELEKQKEQKRTQSFYYFDGKIACNKNVPLDDGDFCWLGPVNMLTNWQRCNLKYVVVKDGNVVSLDNLSLPGNKLDITRLNATLGENYNLNFNLFCSSDNNSYGSGWVVMSSLHGSITEIKSGDNYSHYFVNYPVSQVEELGFSEQEFSYADKKPHSRRVSTTPSLNDANQNNIEQDVTPLVERVSPEELLGFLTNANENSDEIYLHNLEQGSQDISLPIDNPLMTSLTELQESLREHNYGGEYQNGTMGSFENNGALTLPHFSHSQTSQQRMAEAEERGESVTSVGRESPILIDSNLSLLINSNSNAILEDSGTSTWYKFEFERKKHNENFELSCLDNSIDPIIHSGHKNFCHLINNSGYSNGNCDVVASYVNSIESLTLNSNKIQYFNPFDHVLIFDLLSGIDISEFEMAVQCYNRFSGEVIGRSNTLNFTIE